MTEYTVHFQKNQRVGTRSRRMIQVEAETRTEASMKAQKEFADFKQLGFKIVRIDHFEDGYLVEDF